MAAPVNQNQIQNYPARMSRFRAYYDANPDQMIGVNLSSNVFSANQTVYMLRARAPTNVTRMMNTAVSECNEAEGAAQQSAFYLSALSGMFPGLHDLSVAMLADAGYTVRTCTEENMFVELNVDLRPWIDTPAALTMFGQLALIIYKNIDTRSYGNFMQARTLAIKSEVGMSEPLTDSQFEVLLSFEVAKNIRTFVGASPRIRAALLSMILANREGDERRHKVCNYLAEIISWTEMSSLVFIFEQLCLTKSPVLLDARVRNEMSHLTKAYNSITSKKYPQYYRIFFPSEAGVTIIRSRFNTLFEVAKKAMSQQSETVNRFQGNSRVSNTVVDQLYSKHIAHLSRTAEDTTLRTFRYLTEFDMGDEDEAPPHRVTGN